MKIKCLFLIAALTLGFASAVLGQTNAAMADIGSATPPSGPYDVAQTLCTYCASPAGTLDRPDTLNYYTDNGANHGYWTGQTFRTGTNSAGYNLASVSIKTAGVDNGGGYNSQQLFHLYLYSASGGTATLLAHFTSSSSFTDGDWVQWNLATSSIVLAANSTYAYGFGRDASGSGWAGLGNSSGNPYSTGELAMLPTAGGAITFGSSHNYDATFEIGLNPVGAPAVAVSVNPSSGLPGQTFAVTATVTPGVGTVTNVTVNLNAIGGAASASLVLSNANVYTNTFAVPAGAPAGAAYLTATATDTAPLQGVGGVLFTVLSPKTVTIDSSKTYQTIEGLGGATAFYAGWITAHPYKNEIYSNAFAGLNLSMLRLGNWFRYPASISGFDGAATEIVANANRLLGHSIPVYMSSWAPPAFLKNNGQVANGGSLIYTNGDFAYAGFAQYWFDSIQAYQSNGVDLTWISIQNEPDWVADYDSCIFKPNEEGTNYASYSKALDAVHQKLASLPSPPKLLAPEVVHIAYNDLANYAATLNGDSFYGINYHLYGGDNNDLASSTNVFPNKPHFMTEFGVDDMMGAATLIHDCLTLAQDSGFNFWNLVWPGTGGGLIQIENPWSAPNTWTNAPPGISEPHGYWLAPSYWAMKHFSYFINPGFQRVSASDNDGNVSSSAYVSPDGLRLVVVLINTAAASTSTMTVNYGVFAAGHSSVFQTVGTNTWQSLGALGGALTLPPQSLTTIVLDKIVTVGAASNPMPTNGATGVSLNASLSWTPGSNAVTHAVYLGTSSNAVANATPTSAEFRGVAWTNEFALSGASWGTTYYWRVDEIAYANTNQGSVIGSFTTAPAVQLPSPWQSQDIGGAVSQSSAIYGNGVFAVTGGGADIWGTSDAFRFAYVTTTGDCTIIARVASVQNINAWSKAGVMIRQSLAANAANALIAVTPGNGVTWQSRSTAGSNTGNAAIAGLNAPYWVKLVRSGNSFTGYRSPDGTNWTQQGTTTITMTSTVYVGLAITSHDSSSVCIAMFDNVTAAGWTTPSLPPVPTDLTATAGQGQAALRWAASSDATSYNVKRSTTNGGPYAVIANVATTNYTDSGLSNGTNYFYVVSALNLAGESADSVPVSVTPQALVPTGLSAVAASVSQINLAWNTLSNATSYTVKRSLTNGGPYATMASDVTATNYADSGLAGGTMYYYVVSAIVSGSETLDSAQAAAATLSPTVGSLVHRYSFSETGGSTIADAVGGPVWSGTLPNGGMLAGGQLALSSSSLQYATLPAGIVGSMSNMTIMAWVNLSSVTYWSRLFDFGNDTTSYMYLTPRNGFDYTARFSISTSGAGGEQKINGNAAVNPGAWHQVAVSLNAGTGILFVDGVAIGTNSSLTLNPASLGSPTHNYLGRSQSGSDPYLNGALDEFRVYNAGLSSTEIAATVALGPEQLLSTNSPAMSLTLAGTDLTVSWPLANAGFTLQSRTNLVSGNWLNVTSPAPQIVGSNWQVTLPPTNAGPVFYRLSN